MAGAHTLVKGSCAGIGLDRHPDRAETSRALAVAHSNSNRPIPDPSSARSTKSFKRSASLPVTLICASPTTVESRAAT